MGTIRREISIAALADVVWDAVRDIGALHTRLVPGMVKDTVLEQDDGIRVVTFDDGLVLRERIISVDDEARRLVWSVIDGPFEHHNASVDVIAGDKECRLIWTADLLPNEFISSVEAIMERGLALTKQTQEASIVEDQQSKRRQRNVFFSANAPILHHVSLFVKDVGKAAKFYIDGIGLSLCEEFDDIIGRRTSGEFSFGVASVFLAAGEGRYVELHPAGNGEMSAPSFPLNHLAFGVADVDQAYNRALKAGGIAVEIPLPTERWDGTPLDVTMTGERPDHMRMAFLAGPSGELMELYQADI